MKEIRTLQFERDGEIYEVVDASAREQIDTIINETLAEKYTKPEGGITEDDLSQEVVTKLNSSGGTVTITEDEFNLILDEVYE